MNLTKNQIIAIAASVGGVILLVLILTFTVFVPQGVTSEGNKQESTLNAVYTDGANYLSNCVVKTEQAANVASANAAAFDKVIKDAVAGTVGASHVDLNTQAGRSALLPILVQAYPDMKGQTDLFNKVVTVIVGCQDDYRNKQSVVLDNVRIFNSWRTGSWKVRTFGGSSFPNNNLRVTIPGVPVVSGQAALDKMSAPLVEASTSGAYNSGVITPQNPFPSPSASK
jgi:hypothetical protein